MELKLIDIILVVVIFVGAYLGFKRGLIKSAVKFFGVFIVIILAFLLKNPVSVFLYTHFPFINLGGDFASLSLLNILIYEAIAFLFLIFIFGIILRFIVVMTGLVEKILKLTVVLGFFSKLFGLVFGFIEYYLICFAALFILNNFASISPYIEEGVLAQKMINSTPLLSINTVSESKAIKEILALQVECGGANEEKMKDCNSKSLDIMLKYKVVSKDVAKKLVDDGKLKIDNVDSILAKY